MFTFRADQREVVTAARVEDTKLIHCESHGQECPPHSFNLRMPAPRSWTDPIPAVVAERLCDEEIDSVQLELAEFLLAKPGQPSWSSENASARNLLSDPADRSSPQAAIVHLKRNHPSLNVIQVVNLHDHWLSLPVPESVLQPLVNLRGELEGQVRFRPEGCFEFDCIVTHHQVRRWRRLRRTNLLEQARTTQH